MLSIIVRTHGRAMRRMDMMPNTLAATRARSESVTVAAPRASTRFSLYMVGAWRHRAPYCWRFPWKNAAPRAGGSRYA